MTLRLAFMGAPEFAASSLAEIAAAGHEIACVYTQPPRPAGRGKALRRTPVHELAETLGLEVRTPERLGGAEEQAAFAALDLDAAVVVAYGLILPQPVLDAPRLGCLNLHPSLLPRWRGAAPIQRAIMAGDTITATQIMRMEAGLDTGPILLSEVAMIEKSDTAGSLHDRLSVTGAQMWPRALAALERDALEATPQGEEGVLYAPKIDKAEARIDWARPAVELDRLVRGLSPFPGAWFEMQTDAGPARVKALNSKLEEGEYGPPGVVISVEPGEEGLIVGTGEGALSLTRLQRAGKPAMEARDFLRGARLAPGDRLA